MKKEILTQENVMADILDYQKDRENLLFDSFSSIFFPIMTVGVLVGIALGQFVDTLTGVIVALLIASFPIYKLTLYLRDRRRLQQETQAALAGGYSIEKATLVNIAFARQIYRAPKVHIA